MRSDFSFKTCNTRPGGVCTTNEKVSTQGGSYIAFLLYCFFVVLLFCYIAFLYIAFFIYFFFYIFLFCLDTGM